MTAQQRDGKRRTPTQVRSDETFRAEALEWAQTILDSHADHDHYNGTCLLVEPDAHRTVYLSDPRPYSAREHKLAYMLKRVAGLKPQPPKRDRKPSHVCRPAGQPTEETQER